MIRPLTEYEKRTWTRTALLAHVELLEAELEAVSEECDRYGLPHSVHVLLRHIYANRDAAMGAKDMAIATLRERLQRLGAQ